MGGVLTPASYAPALQGLQLQVGGGPVNTAMIAAAQAAGFTGIYLHPAYIWTISAPLVFNGVQDFTIESRMFGTIGWSGNITYGPGYVNVSNASGDGIQVYASTPAGSTATQGIVLRGLSIVGANPGNAVVHFGGGQRRCRLENCFVYNTSSTVGSYGLVLDTALGSVNSEDNTFTNCDIAGAYAAIGIDTGSVTQHANDTLWTDICTSGGTYGIVANGGGGHTFLNYYDRSAPSTATVYNHGCNRLVFIGGEGANPTGGVDILMDASAAVTILENRAVTPGSSANTISISAGILICGSRVTWNSNPVVNMTGGTLDLTGMNSQPTLTVSGTAGTILAQAAANPNMTTSGFSGTLTPLLPLSPAQQSSGTAASTTQTVTWVPPKSNAQFKVTVNIQVTAAGTSTVPQLSYTRRGAVAFGPTTIPMWKIDGATTTPTFTLAATGTYTGEFYGQTDNSGSNVQVVITPTGSTFNFAVLFEMLNPS